MSYGDTPLRELLVGKKCNVELFEELSTPVQMTSRCVILSTQKQYKAVLSQADIDTVVVLIHFG